MSEVLLLTISGTAELLGLHPNTVSLMVQRGTLRFIPFGGKQKRIARSEIDRWINESMITGTANLNRRKK